MTIEITLMSDAGDDTNRKISMDITLGGYLEYGQVFKELSDVISKHEAKCSGEPF